MQIDREQMSNVRFKFIQKMNIEGINENMFNVDMKMRTKMKL